MSLCLNDAVAFAMQEDFEKAAEEAKGLPDGTSNDDKLALYGLFKQGTVGDVDTGKPGIWDQKGEQSFSLLSHNQSAQ